VKLLDASMGIIAKIGWSVWTMQLFVSVAYYMIHIMVDLQMLTMRNGLSLHPMCLPGALQPMQLPLSGMSFDEGIGLLTTNTLTGIFSANEESSEQNSLNLPTQCTISNQPITIPSGTNITSSETNFGFEPQIHVNHAPFNLSTSSKVNSMQQP
jgi:hypothetical protein